MHIPDYQKNAEATKIRLTRLQKKINLNSLLRLAVIIVGGAILFQLFQINNVFYVLLACITIIVLFSYLVFRQSKLERDKDQNEAFLKINENELALSRGEHNIYPDGGEFENNRHPYLADLDIFGAKSLFAYVNRTATKDANDVLAGWMSKPASKEEIVSRQQAVEELSEDPEFIQSLQTKLFFSLGSKVNIRKYLDEYFSGKTMIFGNSAMRIYTAVAPFLLLAGVLVSLFWNNISSYVIFLAVVHLLWTIAMAGKVSVFSNRVDRVGATLIAYSDAIKSFENQTFKASLNKALQQKLNIAGDASMSMALNNLGKLIDKLDVRNNMLVGAILNMTMLWDFRQVFAILDWKKNYEKGLIDGFVVMAEYEALLSLSVLTLNHPQWARPTIQSNQSDPIRTTAMSHPLIPSEVSITNNYSSEQHQIALITGSNMAGKSTFLRTLGINAVLAYAGAVVCAKEMQLPVFHLVTYMRIKDNLNESTSTFKAELDRMKFILELVAASDNVFFLIDEMLRGTNSVDKYLGSKAIIQKLLALDGRGMVATHDLQLAELAGDYPGKLANYHFDIQVENGEMLFDYKLKDGECKIFNASLLLRGIGIETEA